MPTPEELADITIQTAAVARRFGMEPRVALLAYSTFGQPWGERSQRVREAVEILDKRSVDFEYDGEMNADVALDRERMALYPVLPLDGHRRTCSSCRRSTRPRSRPRCCSSWAAPR